MGTIWITMGDPRGIGPEVILKALARRGHEGSVRLVGVRSVFERTARELGLHAAYARLEADLVELETTAGLPETAPRDLSPARAGELAGRAIEEAVRRLDPERGDALVTAPLDKHALQLGGYAFPGHTEMLAQLAGASPVAMMLISERLRVALATGHLPLRDVPAALSRERIREVFELTRMALTGWFEVVEPRIAICGLNPHAGDAGALGSEEQRIVAPEVQALRSRGFAVEGPLSGDTVFVRAVGGEFDAVIALFHDQGMIPVKLDGFGGGVNLTLGLPFVRTSPDHGTALDIAGGGVAREDSFAAAFDLARTLARRGVPRAWGASRAGAGGAPDSRRPGGGGVYSDRPPV